VTAAGRIPLLELAQWRRLTAELYAEVRQASNSDPAAAWRRFREGRDSMLSSHPQSPLDAGQKKSFQGLSFYSYDPRYRFRVRVAPLGTGEGAPRTFVEKLEEGMSSYRPFAAVAVDDPAGGPRGGRLTLYWMEGYGGGLFLPFRDSTNGRGTYGGGRYLYDTIKGADLGAGADDIVLDFNFAYNPSCAYRARWVCPLAPAGNTLPFPVEAGERSFEIGESSEGASSKG